MDEENGRRDLVKRLAKELAAEAKAVADCMRKGAALAAASGRTRYRAPPWPGRAESDRKFRDLWRALEIDAASAQSGWRSSGAGGQFDESPCDPFDLDDADPDSRREALRAFERVILGAELRGRDPFASWLLAQVCESAKARARLASRGSL